jgi:hypothetical protein
VCLKNWLDTDVKNQDHSNMYDISKYGLLILFFGTKITLIFYFLYISPILFEFFKFIRATSVNMCYTRTRLNFWHVITRARRVTCLRRASLDFLTLDTLKHAHLNT